MKKILFFIPNLSVGGAEKVLINLVNNMDRTKYDITVQVLFAGGVNEQFLNKDIKFKYCYKKTFRGNSQILKMFSPNKLYKKFVKEHYDIIVSYLEGPTARIVGGCTDDNTKLVSWIHIEQHNPKDASYAFKSYEEAKEIYNRFDKVIAVSQYVKDDFTKVFDYSGQVDILYNTNETQQILELSKEEIPENTFDENEINICVVGKVSKRKGCDKVVNIQKRLSDDGLNTHFFFLGTGSDEEFVKAKSAELNISDKITLLGYQTNPYKYVAKCDMFVCASLAEGFSTAATEALILSVPVVTVEVSGMKEMLGENNEYGIVTENNEDALYEGIKTMLTTDGMLQSYAEKSVQRGCKFSTASTVKAVEDMFESL